MLSQSHSPSQSSDETAKGPKIAEIKSAPSFDATKTAKPVLAIKHITSQPSFWLDKKKGDRQKPLTTGSHALLFLSVEDLQKIKERKDINNVQTVGIRSRWINKLYQTYIKQKGFKQIIILGSGYDVRPFKKNALNQQGKKNAAKYAEVKFWEVDKAAILDDKEKIFKEADLDKNAIYLRTDYTEEGFIEKLKEAKVDLTSPTLFIWEGNTMYLDKEQIPQVMQKLKSAFQDFVITFDYFKQSFIDTLPFKIWKAGIDDIQAFAKQNGLTLLKNESMDQLAKEYHVDEHPSEDFEQYSVCALGASRGNG